MAETDRSVVALAGGAPAPSEGLVVWGELRGFESREAGKEGQKFVVWTARVLAGNEMLSVTFFDRAEAERATGVSVDYDGAHAEKARQVSLAVYVRVFATKAGSAGFELKARGYRQDGT
jgi:hypothetical protein